MRVDMRLHPAVWAAIAAGCLAAAPALAQRNCPSAEDAVVVLRTDGPTPFRLPVRNAEASVVTVFQFPLGGQLMPAGTGQLDYVFAPDRTFGGRTILQFRVSPQPGCGGTLLGKVTLSGSRATQSVDFGGPIGAAPEVCGSDAFVVSVLACAGIGFAWFARRRAHRRSKKRETTTG